MTVSEKLKSSAASALRPALKTGLWIIAITVPVSFGVLLLKITGLLPVIARLFAPLFALFGMPGESALVFVTAGLVNIYACIAVIDTLDLTSRTVTILALMCLISHNLAVECAVQKKTGTSFFVILAVRLAASFAGAFALNLMLPADSLPLMYATDARTIAASGFGAELTAWFAGICYLCAKIIILVTLLMILQRLLETFGIMRLLSNLLKYPLMVLGIPHEAAFLWIVANTLGLAYGAGVIIDHVERGGLCAQHADLLNYHIAISHSLLEDTLLFVAIGVTAGWIIFPRIILAAMVVWIKRFLDLIFGKTGRRRLQNQNIH